MGEKHTQKLGRIHNLIAAGCIILGAAGGLEVMGGLMEERKIQIQYESLAQMADSRIGTDTSDLQTMSSRQDQKAERGAESEKPKAARTPRLAYESPIDFRKLAEINPDITGWIRIPDTGIDYPIVQSSDNHMYLHKSFNGENADAGCIFMDFEGQKDLRGYNNILYGHNMKNGSMFRDVVRYRDEEYFKAHQYFEIYTPTETIHLKAVSCYYIQDAPEVRRTRFRDDGEFDAFVHRMLEPCRYAQMPGKPVENLYTLVTCSYETEDARTVLFAVEADREQADRSQGADA